MAGLLESAGEQKREAAITEVGSKSLLLPASKEVIPTKFATCSASRFRLTRYCSTIAVVGRNPQLA